MTDFTLRRFLRGTAPAPRRAFALALLSAALVLAAGCDPTPAPTDTAGGAKATSSATTTGGGDTIKIEGSDTVKPLAEKWAEAFKAKKGSVNLTVTGAGSGPGIQSLIDGRCDIADASRKVEAKEMEKAKAKNVDMVETAVARDGITIVVNPKNTVKSLTVQQLADIYTGKVKNWKEVGGSDQVITPSGRENSSGTWKYFHDDVLGKTAKYRTDVKALSSNNAIADSVSKEDGGIGYIGVAYATEFTAAGKVREVPIAFKAGDAPVMATSENILSGKYPISRALYNYTNGAPKGVVKEYLDFATGPEGQKIVKDAGFVTLK